MKYLDKNNNNAFLCTVFHSQNNKGQKEFTPDCGLLDF